MKIRKRLLAPTLLTLVVDDQMMMLFAAVHLSAYGPKQTFVVAPHMSAFGGLADSRKSQTKTKRTFCKKSLQDRANLDS